jgi:hypothetical protein
MNSILDEVKKAWSQRYTSPVRIQIRGYLRDMPSITVELPESVF